MPGLFETAYKQKFENDSSDEENTNQIFKSEAQKKRYDKSKRYTKHAAIEMAVCRVQGKMPGPISSAIAGFLVKMKYRMFKKSV